MAKKAWVVKDKCIACGACMATSPSVFDFGADGLAENILGDDTLIPDDLTAEVEDAVAGCPTAAIEMA